MKNIINYAAVLFVTTVVMWIILSGVGRVRKIIAGSIVGLCALTVVSRFLPQMSVGINAVTCLFCGILGVPGFFTLFILKLLL